MQVLNPHSRDSVIHSHEKCLEGLWKNRQKLQVDFRLCFAQPLVLIGATKNFMAVSCRDISLLNVI